MKVQLVLAVLISGFLTMCYPRKEESLHINLVYDTPVNGYYVSGVFYPFDETSETGQIELLFTPVNGGEALVFSNVGHFEKDKPENQAKFTGKNICDYCISDGFKGYRSGDTLRCYYYIEKDNFPESPLYYNAEFQFFDVDFDGKMELLVNDYDKSRSGNHYSVYEINSDGFTLKDEEPFNTINNETRFFPDQHEIVSFIHDGAFTMTINTFAINEDGLVSEKISKSSVE